MKVSAMLLGSLVIFGAAASAQEKAPTPVAEVGFSYSFTRVNPGGVVQSTNANGGYGYAEYNFNRVLAWSRSSAPTTRAPRATHCSGIRRSSICLGPGSTGGGRDAPRTSRLCLAARDSPTDSTS